MKVGAQYSHKLNSVKLFGEVYSTGCASSGKLIASRGDEQTFCMYMLYIQ